jgi:hypothetical protein
VVIPVTDVVIRAVERMGEEQGIKSLKMQNLNKTLFYPADWIAGVDYEKRTDEEIDQNVDDYNDDDYVPPADDNDDIEYVNDDEIDDEDRYDRVDQEEIDELLSEPKEDETDNANPIDVDEANEEEEQADDEAEPEPEEAEPEQEPQPALRRQPERVRSQPKRHTYSQLSKKVVSFATQVKQDGHALATPETLPNAKVETYDAQLAMVWARCMSDMNIKVMTREASYGQQYILQKGLKKFKERGSEAATKELDQLHKRNCFTPVDVSSLTAKEKRKAMEALMFLTEKRDQSVKVLEEKEKK